MRITDGVPASPVTALPEILLRAIEAMAHGITVVENSPERRLVYANTAFVRLSGYPLDEILGRSDDFLHGPESSTDQIAAIRDAMNDCRDITAVLANHRRDNTAFFNEVSISAVRGTSGAVTHFIGTHVDVTERVLRERELTRLARTDALTGLTNQRYLLEQLDCLLPPAAGENLAVMICDLDRFHHINEDFDFETSDRVLAGFADRLTSVVSPDDIIARLAADQFVVVRREPTSMCQSSAEQLVDDIRDALRTPIQASGIAIPVRVNCGIALAPADGGTAGTLIEAARARADMHHTLAHQVPP